MKKIELIFFLPNFGLGGAGSSISKLCFELSDKYNIIILSQTNNYYKKKINSNKIKLIKLKSFRTIFSFKEINQIIKKKIKEKKKIIFISNINYANVLSCILIKKHKDLKIYLVERTPLSELFIYKNLIDFIKKKIIYILILFFYSNSNKIITNSTKISKDFKSILNRKIFTIFPPSIRKFEKKFFFKKSLKTKIITVTRLSYEKNLIDILRALNHLRDKDIHLTIVGDGEEKTSLLRYVKKKNLINNVKFIGQKKNPFKFLSKSNLYINSSFFEGFPNSVVEAINMNVPIIASHSNGGIYDIISKNRDHILYNCGDYKSLAKKIIFFHKNKKKFHQMVMRNKKNIKKFTIKNSTQLYDQLIQNEYK